GASACPSEATTEHAHVSPRAVSLAGTTAGFSSPFTACPLRVHAYRYFTGSPSRSGASVATRQSRSSSVLGDSGSTTTVGASGALFRTVTCALTTLEVVNPSSVHTSQPHTSFLRMTRPGSTGASRASGTACPYFVQRMCTP